MAGDAFLHNIDNLYTLDFTCPFRYLPISAAFFVLFYLMGFDLGFIIFNLINLILNILICLLLYQIAVLLKKDNYKISDKNIIYLICIYLMGLPQIYNYILGQLNLYITFLLLCSLYIFLKHESLKWNFISSIILGISIIIKPTTFLLIPFLIIFQIDIKRKRVRFDFFKNLIRLTGVLIPSLFNIFYFFIYPTLWEGFLETNFTGENPVALSFSYSISQLVTNFFIFFSIPFNQIFILVAVIGIIGGFGFLIFMFRRLEDNFIILGYLFGITIMLLTYFDSWDHHLLNIIPLLIIAILNKSKYLKITDIFTYSLYFFSFFSLVFAGIWFLVYNLFPYNLVPTIFLVFVYFGTCKFLLHKEKLLDKEV